MKTAADPYAGLSPSNPQILDRAYAQNLAEFLRRLDTAGLARLAGAMQAEVSERGICGAIVALGDAQAAIEDVARDGR